MTRFDTDGSDTSGAVEPRGTSRSWFDRVRTFVPLVCALLLLPTAVRGDQGWLGWAGVAVLLVLQVVNLVVARRRRQDSPAAQRLSIR